MNPDPIAVAAYAAGYERARLELAVKRARSRAAQPRRKNMRNIRSTKSR